MPPLRSKNYKSHYKLNAKTGKVRQLDSEYNEVEPDVGGVTGVFRKIEFREGEFQGDPVYGLKIYMGENEIDETFEMGINTCSLSIINTMLNEKQMVGKEMAIGVYTETNDKGKMFTNAWTTINRDKDNSNWAKPYAEIKYLLDKNDPDNFKNNWTEICNKLNIGAEDFTKSIDEAKPELILTDVAQDLFDDEDNDLPF